MKRVRYLHFSDETTGAVADTYKTLVAIIAADTAGHRAALLSLNVGCSDNAPVDETFGCQIQIVKDVSAGGSGTSSISVTAAQMARADWGEIDGVITGKIDFVGGGVEPTTYDSSYPLFNHEFNTRGGFFKEWTFETAPKIGRDQLLGVLFTPRVATARNLSGSITFQEY